MSRIAAMYGVGPEPESGYQTAEVCHQGHINTGGLEDAPEMAAKFCSQCGAETIRACPKCNAPLRGDHVIAGILSPIAVPPNHCHTCGAAFPWTTAKIAAAKEHATEVEGLDDNEKAQLQGAIDDLASGGPRTGTCCQPVQTSDEKSGSKSRRWSLQDRRRCRQRSSKKSTYRFLTLREPCRAVIAVNPIITWRGTPYGHGSAWSWLAELG
jgi:hypothetical protein